MKRIQLQRFSRIKNRWFLILAIFSGLVGLVRIVLMINSGEVFGFTKNWLIPMGHLLQALVFYFIWLSNKQNQKYFIEWDEDMVRYRLAGDPVVFEFSFGEVKSLDIKLDKVNVILSDKSNRNINFSQLDYAELSQVKAKFEEIKARLEVAGG
jgi:hypothetical protein